MRIQHNIMAMNAYRNYNTNTSALASNLEKLSSGYKINRAGDDAAGLAISEKMRAQITGLEAAQKNVKDGISLVKTAEGAMQEIQDMLNRMDYLATQSANGTYQDEVDRENLNKEMEALKTEIDRIAESANFNGIKLLDGSLDSSIEAADAVTETVEIDPSSSADMKVGGNLPDIGKILGTDTVAHNEALSDKGTQFDVDLHNFTFDASKAGNTMTLTVGDNTFKLTVLEDAGASNANGATDADAAKATTGDALTDALLGKNANIAVEVNGTALSGTLTFESDGLEYDATNGLSKLTIGGQEFSVAASDRDSSTLTFTQETPPKSDSEVVDGSMNVSITGATAATPAQFSIAVDKLTAGGTVTIDGTDYDAADIADASATLDNYDLSLSDDGNSVILTAKVPGAGTAPAITLTAADGEAGTSAANFTNGSAAVVAVYNVTETRTFDEITNGASNGDTLTVAGVSVTYNSTTHTDLDSLLAAAAAGSASGWTLSALNDAGGNAIGVTFTATTAGAIGSTGPAAAPTGGEVVTTGKEATPVTVTYDLSKWDGASDVTIDGTKVYDSTNAAAGWTLTGYTANYDDDTKTLTLTASNAGPIGSGTAPTTIPGDASFTMTGSSEKLAVKTLDRGSNGDNLENITQGSNGDWNVSTTNVRNVDAGGVNRLASTYFELSDDMVQEGSVLTIGGVDYTFTADAMTDTDIDISSGDLATIAQKLTEAASDNAVWTVGVGKTPTTITLTETLSHAGFDDNSEYEATAKYDLRTKEGIEESLGFKGVTYTEEKVVTEAVEAGKALNLQIGDTSDDFNQMKISIGDMHVSAMKTVNEDGTTTSIADVDIKTSESAQAAVDVIKNAINYVSSIRGDLGAYQNRLEHTANNLSVMAENIQDAESTIRDTDIAEEMMAYTKNNILVQSAQAMLAQANAVPQGVLQLLG